MTTAGSVLLSHCCYASNRMSCSIISNTAYKDLRVPPVRCFGLSLLHYSMFIALLSVDFLVYSEGNHRSYYKQERMSERRLTLSELYPQMGLETRRCWSHGRVHPGWISTQLKQVDQAVAHCHV